MAELDWVDSNVWFQPKKYNVATKFFKPKTPKEEQREYEFFKKKGSDK